jgi:putative membrane protein
LQAPDPAREKVERGDAILRESQEPVIDDPTVFVKGAALGALTLVALAKLGLSRSQDPKLRGVAERVRTDQEAMRRELVTIAGRKRLDVPAELIYADEQMLAGAPQSAGAGFDAWFARQLHTEHLKALGLFEAAANMKDAELGAFAKKSLPTLEADRELAAALVV